MYANPKPKLKSANHGTRLQNCLYECTYDFVQLWYTVLHSLDVIMLPNVTVCNICLWFQSEACRHRPETWRQMTRRPLKYLGWRARLQSVFSRSRTLSCKTVNNEVVTDVSQLNCEPWCRWLHLCLFVFYSVKQWPANKSIDSLTHIVVDCINLQNLWHKFSAVFQRKTFLKVSSCNILGVIKASCFCNQLHCLLCRFCHS